MIVYQSNYEKNLHLDVYPQLKIVNYHSFENQVHLILGLTTWFKTTVAIAVKINPEKQYAPVSTQGLRLSQRQFFHPPKK